MLDHIISKGMDSIARQGWEQFNLREFARQESIDFYQLITLIPNKEAFLNLSMVWISSQQQDLSTTLKDKDAVFEAIMGRLDLLHPWRPALRRIKESFPNNLPALKSMLSLWTCHLSQEFQRRYSSSFITTWSLVALYLRAFWTWVEDDENFSQTMKILDQSIQYIEKLNVFSFEN